MELFLKLRCFTAKEALENRDLLCWEIFMPHLQLEGINSILNSQDGQRVEERKWNESWFADEAYGD